MALQDSAQLFPTAGAAAHKDEVNMVVVLGGWLDLVILKVLSSLNNSVCLRRVFEVLERSWVIEGKGSAVCHLWGVKGGQVCGGNSSALVWGLHQQSGNRSEIKCALIE